MATCAVPVVPCYPLWLRRCVLSRGLPLWRRMRCHGCRFGLATVCCQWAGVPIWRRVWCRAAASPSRFVHVAFCSRGQQPPARSPHRWSLAPLVFLLVACHVGVPRRHFVQVHHDGQFSRNASAAGIRASFPTGFAGQRGRRFGYHQASHHAPEGKGGHRSSPKVHREC